MVIGYNQVSLGSLVRIGLICSACLWLPLGLLFGVFGMAGADVVKINGHPVSGASAVGGGLLIGAAFTLLGTLSAMIGALLSRLFAFLFRGQRLRLVTPVVKMNSGV